MLSLGIPIDFDDAGDTIVDLNIGGEVKAKDFPQDSEFQLLAFRPNKKRAKVVWIAKLAEDIAEALATVDQVGPKKGRRPDWYRRLSLYASGMSRRGVSD
jgi:hypothetical protein